MRLSTLSAEQVRRNLVLGVANGALFRLFNALTDPSLVLTWFVSQLTASPVAIGLLLPISQGGWFLPQLLVSGLVQRMPRRMSLYRATAFVRVLSLALIVASVFIIGDRNPSSLLVAFLILYSAYSLVSGVAGLPFMDVVGKAIPADRRGSFFAWRRFTGGVLALGASALTSYVLDERPGLAFPMNFGWLFAAAALAMGAGFFFFAQVVEPVDAVQDGSPCGMGSAWHSGHALARSELCAVRNSQGGAAHSRCGCAVLYCVCQRETGGANEHGRCLPDRFHSGVRWLNAVVGALG